MELQTVLEVAERLHLHEKTVRQLIRDGRLGHVRIGKRILVSTDQFDLFVDECRHDAY